MKKVRKWGRLLLVMLICMFCWSTAAQAASKAAATIGKTKYATVQKAISAVKKGQTIKLQKNIVLKESLIIPKKKFTWDLNRHTVKAGKNKRLSIYFMKGSNVTLKNGTIKGKDWNPWYSTTVSDIDISIAQGAKLMMVNADCFDVNNRGTLVLKKVTCEGELANNTGAAKAKMTIKSGKFHILFNGGGKVTIENGSFEERESGESAILNQDKTKMIIKNATVSGTVCNHGQMTIEKGMYKPVYRTELNGSREAFYNAGGMDGAASAVIQGGTFVSYGSSVAISTDKADLTITGGTFTPLETGYALVVNNSAAKISGGSFYGKGEINRWRGYSAVCVQNGGTVSHTGGTVTCESSKCSPIEYERSIF